MSLRFSSSGPATGDVAQREREARDLGKGTEAARLGAFGCSASLDERADGSIIAPDDPDWGLLVTSAEKARAQPAARLKQRHISGDLTDDTALAEAFTRWLRLVYNGGMGAALEAYLSR